MRTAYLRGVLFCSLFIFTVSSGALAGEPQWWTDQKRQCGLSPSLAYNTWVQQGSPCNNAAATGGGLTPQQQMGVALAKQAMPVLSQGIHDLFYGKPAPPPDPIVQQHNLAAQQLNNSGVYLYNHKNYPGAINEFEKALREKPNDPVILQNLALAKSHLSDASRAGTTSHDLQQILGSADASSASDLHPPAAALVQRLQDANTVDLRGTTKTTVDPQAVAGQLDDVFGNKTAKPATSQVVPPQVADIEMLFQSDVTPATPSGVRKPFNPNETPQQLRDQVKQIFEAPGGVDDIVLKKIEDDAVSGAAPPKPAPPAPATQQKKSSQR